MEKLWNRWTRVFFAGCIGGMFLNVVTILFGTLNIGPLIGIDFSPDFDIVRLVSDLFWGGIWGFLFLLPFLNKRLVVKGLILSLIPTVFDLLVILPYIEESGSFGLNIGTYTPLLILFFNGCWAVATALVLKQWNSGTNQSL